MKFYDYISVHSDYSKSNTLNNEQVLTRDELYDTVSCIVNGDYDKFPNMPSIDNYNIGLCGTIFNTINIENLWISDGRPYYEVYPSVADFISKLDLNFTPNQLCMPHNLKALLLKFYDGHDPNYILFTITYTDTSTIFSYVVNQGYGDAGIGMMQYSISVPNDCTIDQELKLIYSSVFIETVESCSAEQRAVAQTRWDAIVKLFKIIGTICLIGSDPDLIEPQILTNDLPKLNNHNINSLIDKAKRRGKFGFSLGKKLESIPHTRRPHMYWQAYGPKHSLRRYRTRKGSVIHKDKITNVPTGFEENESIHS